MAAPPKLARVSERVSATEGGKECGWGTFEGLIALFPRSISTDATR